MGALKRLRLYLYTGFMDGWMEDFFLFFFFGLTISNVEIYREFYRFIESVNEFILIEFLLLRENNIDKIFF